MKYVYSFNEGNGSMREVLGGKGANLCEMINLGLPVPNGFIVSTNACIDYYKNDMTINPLIIKQIEEKITVLEKEVGKKFGDPSNPLLVSVRSGARSSMPGMMDTILNLGLNDEIVSSLCEKMDKRFVYDCYRRFISMYSDVVKGYDKNNFERIIDDFKENKNIKYDTEFTCSDLKELVDVFKEKYKTLSGEEFPSDPKKQLLEAIMAVFRSWNNERAKFYRKMNNIPNDWGTAVNVQEMVYGNLNEISGTGVVFSRNPSTGEDKLYGEYLMNAQGEDIVAGVRTPKSIETLKEVMPKCYEELLNICKKLEYHYKDMQDMEFTIENGKLYMLQTRNGKRTGMSAIKIATSMVEEGLITKEEAVMRITPKDIDSLLHPTFSPKELENKKLIANGLPASPGAGSGKVYFFSSDVKKASLNGEKDIILVRLETSPEDIEGMSLSKAVVTVRGGMTSHAAVVARGMGTPCVSGCESLKIDEESKKIIYQDGEIKEGDYISVDATTGNIYLGQTPTIEAKIEGDFEKFMGFVEEIKKVEVRTNADNYVDAKRALELGAKGIGLCRTEHMFFEEERIFSFRKMILADTKEAREKFLEEILPFQRDDFYKLFSVMNGLPVTIRLLDPPLHEFLPKEEKDIENLAKDLKISFTALTSRIAELKEFNPMMGHRGCRLAITYPEIAKMQARAIFEASLKALDDGIDVNLEIMIPLVGEVKEFSYIKNIIEETKQEVLKSRKLKYMIGSMIEVPRGAILANEIAKEAEFFSFGTNDLTQMTFGYSRDDAGKFLNDYYDKKILDFNPFEKLDQKGVGFLIKEAITNSKKTNKNIEFGVCGEQGADLESILFLRKLGIDYVSCSPYRVPIARLGSAKAEIETKK
ncbi:MAG: pyruvate, phosphate dikinase [Bacilli bacterium]